MKPLARLSLAVALLALPLGAANQKPVVPGLQATPVTAERIIQTGGLHKVLLSYYSAAEIDKSCQPEIDHLWTEVKRLASTPVSFTAMKRRSAP